MQPQGQDDANDPFLNHKKSTGFMSNWGSKPSVQKVQEKPTKQKEYKADKGKPAPPSMVRLIVFPMAFFIVTALSFMTLWEIQKWVPIGIAIAMLASVFDQSALGDPKDARGQQVNGLLPSLSGKNAMAAMKVWLHVVVAWLAVFLGAVAGLHADESAMAQFYAIVFGRVYENVLASTPGAAYSDAGKMFFAKSSKVDTARSVGFKEGTNYCAAPIVDEKQGRKSVAFWAIGFDCCDARGNFECGDAGNSNVRGGVRAPPDVVFSKDRDLFTKAVKQAAAVHNLIIDEDVVMLRWVADPDKVAVQKIFAALGICLIGWALFGLLTIILVCTALWAEHEYTESDTHHSVADDFQ